MYGTFVPYLNFKPLRTNRKAGLSVATFARFGVVIQQTLELGRHTALHVPAYILLNVIGGVAAGLGDACGGAAAGVGDVCGMTAGVGEACGCAAGLGEACG